MIASSPLNKNKPVDEKRQFDAWGNIVKLEDGNGNTLTVFGILDRGYTGHEHLFSVGLIHMNGRLYDPKLHRFIQADDYVQEPYNSQNYNRYAYGLNNPLIYTDKNGKFFFPFLVPLVGKLVATLITGAVVGAGIGAGIGAASVAFSQGGFNNWSWGGFGKSIGMGALSGVASAGIGLQFGGIGNFGHEVARGFAHGWANGLISEIGGGSFLQGFASGGLGSLAGSGFQSLGGWASTGVATVGFSALSGGVASGPWAEIFGGAPQQEQVWGC